MPPAAEGGPSCLLSALCSPKLFILVKDPHGTWGDRIQGRCCFLLGPLSFLSVCSAKASLFLSLDHFPQGAVVNLTCVLGPDTRACDVCVYVHVCVGRLLISGDQSPRTFPHLAIPEPWEGRGHPRSGCTVWGAGCLVHLCASLQRLGRARMGPQGLAATVPTGSAGFPSLLFTSAGVWFCPESPLASCRGDAWVTRLCRVTATPP